MYRDTKDSTDRKDRLRPNVGLPAWVSHPQCSEQAIGGEPTFAWGRSTRINILTYKVSNVHGKVTHMDWAFPFSVCPATLPREVVIYALNGIPNRTVNEFVGSKGTRLTDSYFCRASNTAYPGAVFVIFYVSSHQSFAEGEYDRVQDRSRTLAQKYIRLLVFISHPQSWDSERSERPESPEPNKRLDLRLDCCEGTQTARDVASIPVLPSFLTKHLSRRRRDMHDEVEYMRYLFLISTLLATPDQAVHPFALTCLPDYMDTEHAPKVIVVSFYGGPYQPQVRAAHKFVVENYEPGDHVMLLGWFWDKVIGAPRYTAVRQLATALDAGTTSGVSGSSLSIGRIPIKCVYLKLLTIPTIQWSVVDRALLEGQAYVVQRGPHGRIVRKEAWLSPDHISRAWLDWLLLQTSHIIAYSSNDLVDSKGLSGLVRKIGQPKLLSATIHSNCTKRRQGTPSYDAIPTGGQLTRVSQIMGCTQYWNGGMVSYECLVSSHLSFAEGEYEAVSNMPLVGPRFL
ncbi:hypothetical protein BDV93DRAFT_510734 [Ceratobasidium sp. AG-I]|nr:hypothetical protein BDV93DRAFT_510734 [Ceratobasidium sp. AG-I]